MILEKQKVLELAERYKIVIIGRSVNQNGDVSGAGGLGAADESASPVRLG